MQQKRGKSLTWATQEARILVDSLVSGPLTSQPLAEEAFAEIPMIVVERRGERVGASINDLRRAKELWTVHSLFLQSAEYLIREAGGKASLSALVEALKAGDMALPVDGLVSEVRSWAFDSAFDKKEVDRIIVNREARRMDLRWVQRGEPARWYNLRTDVFNALSEKEQRELGQIIMRPVQHAEHRIDLALGQQVFVAAQDSIEVVGRTNEVIVRGGQKSFVLPATRIGAYFRQAFETTLNERTLVNVVKLAGSLNVLLLLAKNIGVAGMTDATRLRRLIEERFGSIITAAQIPEIVDVLALEEPVAFDPLLLGRERWADAVAH